MYLKKNKYINCYDESYLKRVINLKKMMMLIIILTIFSISLFCGCTEENKFAGKWKSQIGVTYEFKSDGDLIVEMIAGTWKLEDEKLILQTPENSLMITIKYTYSFSDDDNTLTLVDSSTGITKILIKQ